MSYQSLILLAQRTSTALTVHRKIRVELTDRQFVVYALHVAGMAQVARAEDLIYEQSIDKTVQLFNQHYQIVAP